MLHRSTIFTPQTRNGGAYPTQKMENVLSHTSSVNRLPRPPSSELGVPLLSNVAAVPAVPGGDPGGPPPPFLSNRAGLVGDDAPGPSGGDDMT